MPPPPTIRNLYDLLTRDDLASFIARCFHTINPATPFLPNWHIELIAEYLKAVTRGEITRLIINMPPRMLKSLSVSVAWPAWLLGHQPARRILCASYAQHLSLKHALDTRHILQAPWYRAMFPKTQLQPDQNRKEKFMTMERGFRLATSIGGSITGEGGNFLIVDDPQHPAQAESTTARQTVHEWFDQSFLTRLDDKKQGAIVVVMQRLHEEDLSGYLLQKPGKRWEHLCLPAIAEAPAYYAMGALEFIRAPGELLHPAREGETELQNTRQELGSMAFAAQYQQQPLPPEGELFRPHWIQRYTTPPEAPEHIVQSWDTAIKAGKQHDFSVCTSWAICTEGYYLLDVFCARLEYPALRKQIIFQSERYQPDAILLEDKASGQSLLQELRRETALPLIAIQPLRDKLTRAASASALFESGRVYLPQYAHWLAGYEQELLRFPATTHDDQVDSTTQFLNWIRQGNLGKSATLRRL
ncbi:MAG: phage terminase large subunit [Hyphomicrobiales bacterium]|nr:phage terminase large subunit [Hyphomicrobiales bacterium]